MAMLGWLVVVVALLVLAVVIGWLGAFVWNAVARLRAGRQAPVRPTGARPRARR